MTTSDAPPDLPPLDQLRHLTVESAWAALFHAGYPNQFIANLQVIHPDLTMVGRARTLRYLPLRPDLEAQMKQKLGGRVLQAVAADQSDPGDVLVVDAFGCIDAGVAGDIILTRFLHRGGAGVVVDGALRDLSFLRQLKLPLYVRGTHAAASYREIVAVDHQVPVQIAGVTVMPGDYLLGDAEGVLVIPPPMLDPVIAQAADTDRLESFLRTKIEQGAPLEGTYPPNEATRAQYDRHRQRPSTGG